MIFDDKLMTVLKNFSNINSNLMVYSNTDQIMTINESKSVYACYNHRQSFDNDFAIYDLSSFISALSMFDDKDVEINEKHMIVKDLNNRSKLRYVFANPDLITKAPQPVTVDEFVCKFTLDSDTLNKLRKAQGILDLSTVKITGTDKNVITISLSDPNDPSNNDFSIDVNGEINENSDFEVYLTLNNLTIVNDSYDVEISPKMLAKFTAHNYDLFYFIALDRRSTI